MKMAGGLFGLPPPVGDSPSMTQATQRAAGKSLVGGTPGCSWGSLGAPWELSSGALGLLGAPSELQECSRGTPEGCLGVLGRSPGALGMAVGALRCSLGALGSSWVLPGAPWVLQSDSWKFFGRLL